MSDTQTDTTVNWKNLKCLYAEDLKNKHVSMIIGAVRDTPEGARLFCRNMESEAWDIAFAATTADGKTPYIQIPKPNAYGKASGLLRTYKAATGGDPCEKHVGQKITLIPVKSTKSATGRAIRVAILEHAA